MAWLIMAGRSVMWISVNYKAESLQAQRETGAEQCRRYDVLTGLVVSIPTAGSGFGVMAEHALHSVQGKSQGGRLHPATRKQPPN